MEIDRAWQENYFVVKANILHSRVHEPGYHFLRGVLVFTDVEVWNDELGINGKLDCLELKNNKYCIVEYKPSKPKNGLFRKDDLIQIYAQKLCAEGILKCECETAIYYGDVKKRYNITDAEFDGMDEVLATTLHQMRNFIEQGCIPAKRDDQNCKGCSLYDLCMPGTLKKKKSSLRKSLETLLKES